MNLKWFLSKTVRHATEMRKHVAKLLNAQRDILSPPAIEAITAAMLELKKTVDANEDNKTLLKQMENLEKVANKWLKPYPHSAVRENIEVILVAVAVAMSIRTFFLQPFKIPTGSMQPTLYGVTSTNLKEHPEIKIPSGLARFYQACVRGTFYHYLAAEDDGELVQIGEPEHVLRFINKQRITMRYRGGEKSHLLWFTPDDHFAERAGVHVGDAFHKGEAIIDFKETAGDHLFVNRLTYNFRHPTRGEIIVFETKGIEDPRMPQDQFYIKRLVALGGERVQIGDDRHLTINRTNRLDASTPHFENVYSFNPKEPPQESHYSGHVNFPHLAPLFQDKQEGYVVRPDHYMVMGDNTVNSFDSRAWGDFSRTNVIGKSCFVYWPISERFGWGHR
ncbi:MAG: signal peptidase I [Verrucomicrobia bacterium]|nr:signal peptidase I [Verrucomicrobiota bacterium]